MATVSNTVSVPVSPTAPALLYQTSSGVSPDPETTLQGNTTKQIFMAGTPTVPLRVQIENTDATNPIYIGGSGVTSATGIKVAAGALWPLEGPIEVVGNDSLYAIATGGAVNVNVLVGPFQ